MGTFDVRDMMKADAAAAAASSMLDTSEKGQTRRFHPLAERIAAIPVKPTLSPVMIEGRIYVPSTKGEMIVLATGDKYELLARNPIGEGTHSTPCVDAGRLYVKTFTHLVCIGKK